MKTLRWNLMFILAFCAAPSWAALTITSAESASGTISGTGSAPDSYVEAFADGVSLGSVRADAGGNFSFSLGAGRIAPGDELIVTQSRVWNFNNDGDAEGWVATVSGTSLSVSGGELLFDTGSSGAVVSLVSSNGLDLDGGVHRVIEMRLSNPTGATYCYLRYETDTLGFADETNRAPIGIRPNQSPGTYVTTHFIPGDRIATGIGTSNWTGGDGNIQRLRIDFQAIGRPADDNEIIHIDYIRVIEYLEWDFEDDDTEDWAASADCTVSASGGELNVTSTVAAFPGPTIRAENPNAGGLTYVLDQDYFTNWAAQIRAVVNDPNATNTRTQILWDDASGAIGAGGNESQFFYDAAASAATPAVIDHAIAGHPTATWGGADSPTLGDLRFRPSTNNIAWAVGDAFNFDYIRLQPATPYGPSAPFEVPLTTTYTWDLTQPGTGWAVGTGLTQTDGPPQPLGLDVTHRQNHIQQLSIPPAPNAHPWLVLRMRSQSGYRGFIRWTVSGSGDEYEFPFLVEADGEYHNYNLQMINSPYWFGDADNTITRLRISPSNVVGDHVDIESVSLSDAPLGAPDVRVRYFGLEDTLNRVGRPCPVLVRLVNMGGTTATLQPVLTPPPGVTLTPFSAADEAERDYACNRREDLRFIARAAAPVDATMGLQLVGTGAPTGPLQAPIAITASPTVPQGAVPAPNPAPTDYTIGMYYFPQWYRASNWQHVWAAAPERKPALGYYDERIPEAVDWQIKWALDYGINFIALDWYWAAGGPVLDGWFYDGFMNAQYRDQIDWAVLWINQRSEDVTTEAQYLEVAQYWIDTYFGMSNYLFMDGKPVVFIWNQDDMRTKLGGSAAVAQMLAAADQLAQDAGYAGITFNSMWGYSSNATPSFVQTLAGEGFVSHSAYNWLALAPNGASDPTHFSYQRVLDLSPANWASNRATFEANGMHLIPALSTGWDSYPWGGVTSRYIFDRTVARFESLMTSAKAHLDANGETMLILGPLNEWGEGQFIEPCTQYGFGMYEAVHRVFSSAGTLPVAVGPVDVGLGPYDAVGAPLDPKASRWTFNQHGNFEGWAEDEFALTPAEVSGGLYQLHTAWPSGTIVFYNAEIDARDYDRVTFRIRASGPASPDQPLRFYWAETYSGFTGLQRVSSSYPVDGQFHELTMNLSTNPYWRGRIGRFRIDPCQTAGLDIAIDEIRLEPQPETPGPAGVRSEWAIYP